MFKFPDPKTTDPKERRVQRFIEIIPGTLTWMTFILIFALSFLAPVWASVFIIVFTIHWMIRIVFITYYTLDSRWQMRKWKKIDWWKKCQKTVHPEAYLLETQDSIRKLKDALKETPFFNFRERSIIRGKIANRVELRDELKKLVLIKDEIWDWRSITHVVLFPTAGEPPEVIEPAIQAIADSNFPKEQIIILLATEERENEEHRLAKVKYLKEKFDGVFKDFLVTTHIVADGEMKCKASNSTFAAKELMKYLDARNIDYKRVIHSNFDCDTVAHPQYLAAVTYAYITTPQRLQRAYQPMPEFTNNLWDTNAVARIVVTGCSFWHLFQSTRKEMVTFSSHSESFDTIVKVGFWPLNMISEDSIIYWKCLSYFDGDYEVYPIRLPVTMDAVLADSYWKIIKNQYIQKRRWAYGIENYPVVLRALWPNKKIRLKEKLRITFEMLEGHYSWATTSFILAFLGWLPLILGGDAFRQSVLAHNLPVVTEFLMRTALLGVLVSVPLSFLSLPPKPKKYHWIRYSYMLFQWFLIPVIGIYSSITAIDSQTRILTKNYFGEFWVTEKMRKKD